MNVVKVNLSCPWCGEPIEVSGKPNEDPEVTWQACNCTINLDSWPSLVEAWQWEAGL